MMSLSRKILVVFALVSLGAGSGLVHAQLSPAQVKAQRDQAAREAAAQAERERAAANARSKGSPVAPTRKARKSNDNFVTLDINNDVNQDELYNDLSKIGVYPPREISNDRWITEDEGEYYSLGKNAILKLISSTINPDELPLKSVYVIYNGRRVNFSPFFVFDKEKEGRPRAKGFPLYNTQISFYLIPVHYIKHGESVVADFSTGRVGFVITKFEKIPDFVFNDENDSSSEPDMSDFVPILVREYPDDARKMADK